MLYQRVRRRFGTAPILLDGPVGAEAVRRGIRWRKHGMLADSEAVARIHQDYLAAGADLLRTNTFGLNGRIYLNVFKNPAHMAHIGAPGLADLADRLLDRAVALAREARGRSGRDDVPIAGVISPLEHVFRPDRAPDYGAAREEHGRIADRLASGCDLLLLEAFGTDRETRAAVDAAADTDHPFWASFAVGESGDLLSGESLAVAARYAVERGAAALIATAAPLADVLRAHPVLARLGQPTGVAPLCGLFDPPSWKFEFHPQFAELPDPRAFAREVRAASNDTAIVGAWCGATPEHIAALRREVPSG